MAENSGEVNFQNFPKKENKEIRNVITCPPGYLIVSFDYSGLEARILAMASKDRVFCDAIWNNVDTHLRWAKRLAELHPPILEKLTIKELRYDIKGGFVFAGFYGAGRNSVMRYYETEYGVPNEIIDKMYTEFWNVYIGVKRWQNETYRFYNSHGYALSLSGRKRRAPLTFNQIVNQPIQSSASYDICIVAGDRLSKIAYETNTPQYQYRLNVHDDLTFYIPTQSLIDDIFFIGKEMVRPVYDWIIVPLEVEFSVGTQWGELQEVGKISTSEFWNYKEDGEWVERCPSRQSLLPGQS